MESITDIYNRIVRHFNGQQKPAMRIVSAALSGAVMICTTDGSVVITPQAAREMLQKLPALIELADAHSPEGLGR